MQVKKNLREIGRCYPERDTHIQNHKLTRLKNSSRRDI
jgi:hypothetical protein